MTKRQKYFRKQKAIGIGMVVGTIVSMLILGGDVTLALITIPAGLGLFFTKKMVWMDDYYWEVAQGEQGDKEL